MNKDELTSVLDSDYKDYFEGANSRDVYLLSKTCANAAWEEAIDSKAKSYFDLPDDNWVVTCNSTSIGDWMTSYNDDERKPVSKILRRNVNWPEDTIIHFFVNRDIVFQSTWFNFIEAWDDFIAVEDDCPMIVPTTGKTEGAILFRPIGDICKIEGITLN